MTITVNPPPDWSWKERLRFFLIGISFSAFAPLIPMIICIWWDLVHWDNAIEWRKYGLAALGTMAQPALQYWREHRALLKVPPWLTVPPEFAPISAQAKSVEVKAGMVEGPSGQPMMATQKTTVETEMHPVSPTPEPPLGPPSAPKP